MSQEIANYIEDQSEKVGISQSAYMLTAIKNYIDQQEALQMAKSLPDWFNQIQQLKETLSISNPQSPEGKE